MEANHLKKLKRLQKLAKELHYTSTISEESATNPFDILSININDEKEHLDLVFYPENEELDGANFLQFFYQYPFILSDKGLEDVMQILPKINNRMSLGHFSINFNEKKVQFKYVLALPLNLKIEALYFKDILDMRTHTPKMFQEIIEELGTDSITLEKATILLNEIQ